MEPAIIYIPSKKLKRALRAEMPQHAAVAVVMFWAGLEKIFSPHVSLLAFAEVLAGIAVLVSSAIHLRKKDSDAHTSVDWPLLFASFVSVLEGFHRRETGSRHLPYVYWALAAVLFLRSVFFSRLIRLRRIEINENRIRIRTSPLKRVTLRREQLASIEIGKDAVEFRLKSGRVHTLDLQQLLHPDEVRERLQQALATSPQYAEMLPAPAADQPHIISQND